MSEPPARSSASPAASPSVLGALRAGDPLAWAGLAGAFVFVLFLVYWGTGSLVHVFEDERGYAADFWIYNKAGVRLLADPATLYADPSFLYPPPAGALFGLVALLSIGWGYALFAALNLAAMVGCLRLGETLLPDPPRGWARAALWCAALGSAPALQNVKWGQVNVFILLISLAFLAWLRERPFWAGAILAVGGWLKLYPAVLGILALRKGRYPAVAGAAFGVLAVVVLALPLVPPALYVEYVRDVLPEISRETTLGTLNAGIPAVIERMFHGPNVLVEYRSASFGPAASLAGRLVLVGGLAGSVWAWMRGWRTEAAGVMILAVVAVSASFGWEYTFVLTMPFALACLLLARRGPGWVRATAVLAFLALFLQKPPEAVMKWGIAHVPAPLLDLFAARFLLALTGLAVCALVVRRERVPASP